MNRYMNSELTSEKLIEHIGHNVVITTYGDPAVNVALECEDCSTVLADADYESEPAKGNSNLRVIGNKTYDAICDVIDRVKTDEQALDTDQYASMILDALNGVWDFSLPKPEPEVPEFPVKHINCPRCNMTLSLDQGNEDGIIGCPGCHRLWRAVDGKLVNDKL